VKFCLFKILLLVVQIHCFPKENLNEGLCKPLCLWQNFNLNLKICIYIPGSCIVLTQFLSITRDQETSSTSETPPVRPKRGIKKCKGKGVTFSTEVKNSEEGTSSPASGNRISFDQEAFSCAVQNILGKSGPLKLKCQFKQRYMCLYIYIYIYIYSGN
jgi:hypothetical protein